jgi:hypothetical protein
MLFSQLRNIHCAFDPADSNSQVIMITLSFVTATPINVPAKADISSVGVMLSFSDNRRSDRKNRERAQMEEQGSSNPKLAKLLGRIRLPENCANLAFGGPKRNHLFMTASQSLYVLQVQAQGAAPG